MFCAADRYKWYRFVLYGAGKIGKSAGSVMAFVAATPGNARERTRMTAMTISRCASRVKAGNTASRSSRTRISSTDYMWAKYQNERSNI